MYASASNRDASFGWTHVVLRVADVRMCPLPPPVCLCMFPFIPSRLQVPNPRAPCQLSEAEIGSLAEQPRAGKQRKDNRLQQDQPDVRRLHVLAAPVVQIVLQAPVADTELELLENLLIVVEDVQGVEDVEVKLLGDDQSLRHQLCERNRSCDIVERISRPERGILLVSDDGRRQRIETQHIRNLFGCWILLHITVHNSLLDREPVLHFSLSELTR
mmetsp:Transcript_26363/g.59924  ORF Transcript_26363/g.59924 Transcript_26363/m.59924 type:complete len:216 (-) Transcript_26363:1030-1677(-)